MKVANKYTGEVFKVYDIKNQNGNLKFLIFDGKWTYIDAYHYVPYDDNGFFA